MAKTYFINVAIFITILHATMGVISPDPKEFFKNTLKGSNLTSITWAHAVNSKAELDKALSNKDIMMLEADISMGTLDAGSSQIPIMAHPPNKTSDLSLEGFLKSVIADGKKGVKLDFKSIEAFVKSLPELEKNRPNMTFPVWLNADILSGPGNPTDNPVDPVKFLTEANSKFNESTLSIGWTTRHENNSTNTSYTSEQIQKMIETVTTNLNNSTQSVTYAVRAGFAANSASLMSDLLKNTSAHNPTLTIWSSESDPVDEKKLSQLIKDIGVDKSYIDLPKSLKDKLEISAAPRVTIGSTIALVLSALLVNFGLSRI